MLTRPRTRENFQRFAEKPYKDCKSAAIFASPDRIQIDRIVRVLSSLKIEIEQKNQFQFIPIYNRHFCVAFYKAMSKEAFVCPQLHFIDLLDQTEELILQKNETSIGVPTYTNTYNTMK